MKMMKCLLGGWSASGVVVKKADRFRLSDSRAARRDGRTTAETPSDVLRAECLTLAAQHPEMTGDAGDSKFMIAIGPKLDSRIRSKPGMTSIERGCYKF
jgi:hypothetical protein